MARSYLVDGHNVLHALFGEPPADPDAQRRAVTARATASVRTRRGGATGDRVHVVFDSDPAQPRAGTHGKDGAVSWSYARGSADEEIVRLVRLHEGEDHGLPIVVVTDDRELRGRAGQLGAETLGVRAWLGAAEPEEPRERPISTGGPPMTAGDFGLPESIDLDSADADDL